MARTTGPIGWCRLASTAAVVLDGAQTVDGIDAQHGDRVLVKDQAANEDNGIYICDHTGPWPRADDFDHVNNAIPGRLFYITEGTANAQLLFFFDVPEPFVLDTDAVIFTESGLAHATSNGNSHSNVVLNNTHRTGTGIDHSQVLANAEWLAYQPRAHDPHLYTNFCDAAGSALKTPWTAFSAGGGVFTQQFKDEPYTMGSYEQTFDNAVGLRYMALYHNDVLRIPPVTPVGDGVFICDFAFVWSPAGVQGDAATLFIAGLGEARNNNVYNIPRYLRVLVSGANMDLYIEGEDGVTTTSTDTGFNISKDAMTRIRFTIPQSGGSQGVATVELSTYSSSWLTLGNVDVSALGAANYMQPLFEVQKNSAALESLEVCYFSAYRRLAN